MIRVAVPALPVVLPHELPVRAHLVVAHGRDLRALEPLWREQRGEVLCGRLERDRIGGGQAHEDEPADLADVRAMQAVVAPIEVAVSVHSAAGHQIAVTGVRPLVIRADDASGVAGLGLADLHPAMAAGVVERVDLLVVATDDDDRVGVHVEDEVVARALHLTGVAGEEPAAAPDALQVELVDSGIGLELARQRVAGLVLGDQTVEQRPGFGGRHRPHYRRRRAPAGSYSTSGATSAAWRVPNASISSGVPVPASAGGR